MGSGTVRLDSLKTQREASAVAASASIGGGGNGVVTTTVDAAGGTGNLYTIRVVLGVGLTQALAAAVSTKAITVTLATDGAGAPDDTANTATLVAAAVDALAGVSAVASGNGSTPFSSAIAATAFSGGRDAFTRDDVARGAVCPLRVIDNLENGGSVREYEAQRIADYMGVSLATLGIARL